MEFLESLLEHSVHLLTVIVVALLARLIPTNKNKSYDIDFSEFIKNPKKEVKWGYIVIAYMFLILPIVAYPIGVILEKTDYFVQHHILTQKTWFFPSFIAYYIIGLCFVYMLACLPSRIFLKEILKKNYEEYIQFLAYSEFKNGISNRKASILFFIIFSITLVGLLFVLEKTKTSIYDHQIEFSQWGKWENKTYSLSEIKKIEFAKKIKYDKNRTESEDLIKITFKDGDDWNSVNYNFDDSFRSKIELISDSSHIKIDTLQVLLLK